MAINLNCNLNGGDTVTPNNELFYRVYGDVDNYSSPIHTTGTAIADADVTVAGDVVDISNIDETTNTSFKISSVDETGNEGILSDAYSSVNVLFEDDFTGTTIDTTTKWNLTNVNPTRIDFSQNDELIIDSFSTTASAGNDNNLLSQWSQLAGTTRVMTFDITCTDSDNVATWGIGLQTTVGDITNRILMYYGTEGSGAVNFISNVDGTLDVYEADYALDISTVKTIKMVDTGSNVSFHYWDGSWVEIASGASAQYTTQRVFIFQGSNAPTFTTTYDNLVILNTDFTTQRP